MSTVDSSAAAVRRDRDNEDQNSTSNKPENTADPSIKQNTTITNDVNAMFDLAGGSAEEPLLATLVPAPSATKKSSSHKYWCLCYL